MKCLPAALGSDGALGSSFCCRLKGTGSRVELSRKEEEGGKNYSASGAALSLSPFVSGAHSLSLF